MTSLSGRSFTHHTTTHTILSVEDDEAGVAVTTGNEVVAQLAQSQDGFIATRTGDACFVSGEADRTHLHRIRASVGAVLVGAQTVVADDPQLTVRAVAGDNPVRVILDPHARVPAASTVFTVGAAPTLWMIGAEAALPPRVGDHVRIVRLPPAAAEEPVEPAAVLSLVRSHVDGSILIEGGGRTVSRFLSAGVLDRLFLTTAPVFIGDGVPGIRFAGSEVMAQALRTPFRRFVLGEDICTEYLLSPAACARSGAAAPRPAASGSEPPSTR